VLQGQCLRSLIIDHGHTQPYQLPGCDRLGPQELATTVTHWKTAG
jgi:hypothetical protein